MHPFLGVRHLELDLIGYSREKDKIVAVEVKSSPTYLFDGIGRCAVLRMIVDYVYLALPEEYAMKIGSKSFFGEGLGIGLLSVGKEVKEIAKAPESYHKVVEIATLLKSMVRSMTGG